MAWLFLSPLKPKAPWLQKKITAAQVGVFHFASALAIITHPLYLSLAMQSSLWNFFGCAFSSHFFPLILTALTSSELTSKCLCVYISMCLCIPEECIYLVKVQFFPLIFNYLPNRKCKGACANSVLT